MNKKVKVVQKTMQDKFAQTRKAQDEGRSEDTAKLIDECDALQRNFELEKRLYGRERVMVPDESEGGDPDSPGTRKEIFGPVIIAKLFRRQPLSNGERAAITSELGLQKALVADTNTANGEINLMSEDMDIKIRGLRQNYISTKNPVAMTLTTSLSGGFDSELSVVTDLKDFNNGNDILNGTDPTFKVVRFAITLKGMIIPVSNTLMAVETADPIVRLNNWFVKNATYSENKNVFATLKAGRSTEGLAGLGALGESLDLNLDLVCLVGGMVVINQTGQNVMDGAKGANGRPMLQPDPANATQKLFKNLPVHAFSDAQLPNESIKTSIFYGDPKAGCYFAEFAYQLFDASAYTGFIKNRTLTWVIEGYDVIQADVDAYCYGLLDPATINASTVDVNTRGIVTTKAEAAG